MKSIRRSARPLESRDDGLSLVEVLVAVIMIVGVALSTAALSIQGLQTAAAQQRQQVAVSIANGAMENVSGWQVGVNSGTGVSSLYTGRFSTLVAAAFASNSSQPGVQQTYPTGDPTATSSSIAAIPITSATTQNGTAYTTTVLIGTCYEPNTGGSCNVLSGVVTAPASVPTGYTALIRAIVLVSWTAGNQCRASGCFYEATTLADPHSEPNWVFTN